MSFALEEGEICLTHDGGVGVVHLAEEQITAHGFITLVFEQLIDKHHLAKRGGGLCQGQG